MGDMGDDDDKRSKPSKDEKTDNDRPPPDWSGVKGDRNKPTSDDYKKK